MDFDNNSMQYNYVDRRTPLTRPFFNYSQDQLDLFHAHDLFTVADVGDITDAKVCLLPHPILRSLCSLCVRVLRLEAPSRARGTSS
jgi:hypothetical protein